MHEVQFAVQVFNYSASKSMNIDLRTRPHYTVSGNKYGLTGPMDAKGNHIDTTILPGRSKTIYYRDLRSDYITESITLGWKYDGGEFGEADWVRSDR